MIKVLEMFGEPITYGGQESVVYNMLTTFDFANEFVIDLFTPYYADNQRLINFVNANNGKVYKLDLLFKMGDNRFMLTSRIRDFFDKHYNYDVVHIHTGSLATMFVYAKEAKMHGIRKVIVHAHTTNRNTSLLYNIRKAILCYGLNKYVDKFVGCSKKSIETKYTKTISSNALIVYNGIDIQSYKFNILYRNEIRNIYNIQKSQYVIGYLGRLSKEKNLYFMLDLIDRLREKDNDIVLMIVGSGELEKDLKEYVKAHGIDNKVLFTGNQTEAYKFYSAFDLFILPSFYEGFPVTAIEAQVSGLPAIISKCVTMEAKVSDRTYYLAIDNIDIWVDKIIEIKDNYKLYENRVNIDIDYSKCDKNITYKNIERMYIS